MAQPLEWREVHGDVRHDRMATVGIADTVSAECAAIKGQVVVPFAVDPNGNVITALAARDIERPRDPERGSWRKQIAGIQASAVERRADGSGVDSNDDNCIHLPASSAMASPKLSPLVAAYKSI